MKIPSTILIATSISLGILAYAKGAEGKPRPNILIVVTDDQAPWAIGNAVRDGRFTGVSVAHTPNIDRLAREGSMFTNFFCVSPVCSPARAAIATGRYASEFGIDDFIAAPDHKLFDQDRQVALAAAASTTFAEVLRSAGYRTSLIGKWHLGDWTLPGNGKNHPTNHGYDHFIGLTSGGCSPNDPMLEKNGRVQKFDGLTTDILTDHAIEFVEDATPGRQPFLLCLHTRAPHARWLPVAPQDWEPYANLYATVPDYPDLDVAEMKKNMREYLASTSGVDRNLGRLLETIDRLGVGERTIVVFTSDHGYNMGHNGIWHKGNGIWATRIKPPGPAHHGTRVISDKFRPNMYDLSLKVPAIIRWPGVTRAGTVIDATATHLDLFPTLLTMAGIKAPKGLELRGRDLTPVLRGTLPLGWNQDFFGQYSMINYAVAKMRCYRTPRWKLIRDFHNSDRDELYDLKNDPDERQNLIDDEEPSIASVIHDLNEKLNSQMQRIGDPLWISLEHRP